MKGMILDYIHYFGVKVCVSQNDLCHFRPSIHTNGTLLCFETNVMNQILTMNVN